MPLKIADRNIIVARISRDIAQSVSFADVTPGFADNGSQLRFVVQRVVNFGPDNGLQMADLCVGPAREDGRVGMAAQTRLVDMLMIVKADADNLARIGDDGIENDL